MVEVRRMMTEARSSNETHETKKPSDVRGRGAASVYRAQSRNPAASGRRGGGPGRSGRGGPAYENAAGFSGGGAEERSAGFLEIFLPRHCLYPGRPGNRQQERDQSKQRGAVARLTAP